MDFWISFFKILSILSAGLFGVLSLVTRYRDEKTGNITRWGRIALGGVLLSATVSLALQVLETSRAKEAAKKARAEADATAQILKDVLERARTTTDLQKVNLEKSDKLKSDLERALAQEEINAQRTDKVAKGMETSLATQRSLLEGNKRISTDLAGAVTSLKETGRTTKALLEENVGKLDYIGVEIMLEVDPSKFEDESGRNILPDNLLSALKGTNKMKVADMDSMFNLLNLHWELIRRAIFKNAEFKFLLESPMEKETSYSLAGDNGVENFSMDSSTVYLGDSNQGGQVVVFNYRYLVPADRLAGFRKYTDLNGAFCFLILEANADIAYLEKVELWFGSNDEKIGRTLKAEIPLRYPPIRGRSIVQAQVAIPKDYFH